MPADALLRTKLYIPPVRPNLVVRPRLIAQLDEGLALGRKLTLISAPAGFGKTTLTSAWVNKGERPVGWLSLDEGDNDLARFLTYLIAALRTVAPAIGEGAQTALQSSQPPPAEMILTALINELAAVPKAFILVLDDYHLVDTPIVDQALAFLLESMPPQMHLVMATREDPPLPLARLRARGQLGEVRVADLRFTPEEAAVFLNEMMGLNLTAGQISALEERTEGWVAGLQLAALSMRGRAEKERFIDSFSGSHQYVLDYLVEEVLLQQPTPVQTFLLRTSILERLCGPLCDAVLGYDTASGQQTLEYLQQANLFTVSLDDERRWFRFHHLFAELLQQRLQRGLSSGADEGPGLSELHGRASEWYEANGFELEAFQHAAAAHDVARAARLLEGQGIPLHFRGAIAPVKKWLATLPEAVLNERPALWVTYATVMTMQGRAISDVEEKLVAAEAALEDAGSTEETRDLLGQIAAIRAMSAVPERDMQTLLVQAQQALAYLHPDNLPVRAAATWALGLAYQYHGDRAAASETYEEAIALSEASGNSMFMLAALTSLGQIREGENKLYLAETHYRRALALAGKPPLPVGTEAALGLARLQYEWNDLPSAERYAVQSLELARQMETVDTPAGCMALVARLKLAQGDTVAAASLLDEAERFLRRLNMLGRMAEVAAVRVRILLQQRDLAGAAALAAKHKLAPSRARVYLAQGDPAAALDALVAWCAAAEARGEESKRLQALALQALALQTLGEMEQALALLEQALTLAEPGGLVRLFLDEGPPMAQLLGAAAGRGIEPAYTSRLLAAFAVEGGESVAERPSSLTEQPLDEPLSERELEVLQLVAQGLSNREIGERLFLAVNTVKGHNRRIFAKLSVQRRTEAVARARALGLL